MESTILNVSHLGHMVGYVNASFFEPVLVGKELKIALSLGNQEMFTPKKWLFIKLVTLEVTRDEFHQK